MREEKPLPNLRWKREKDPILAMMQAAGSAPKTLQQLWLITDHQNKRIFDEWRDVPTQQEGEE